MVYFAIKNKDLTYILQTVSSLKLYYTSKNIRFEDTEPKKTKDGDWYITIARDGDINAHNV